MKKKLMTSVLVLSASIAIASAEDYYHYVIITGCGKTQSLTFDHELGDQELLDLADYYEAVLCEKKSLDE